MMKSCAQVARYLRQPMEWVEGQDLDTLNRWSDVVSEILKDERGVKSDEGPADPFGILRTDD